MDQFPDQESFLAYFSKKRASVVDMPPNDEQMIELREAFSLFDMMKVGEITTRELRIVMASQGFTPSDDELDNMLNEVDEDGSGTIEFEEFCSLMTRKVRPQEQEDEIQAAFKMFDKDGDGYISAKELQEYMAALGQELTMEEVLEMIKEADEDKDGRISYNEFCSLITG